MAVAAYLKLTRKRKDEPSGAGRKRVGVERISAAADPHSFMREFLAAGGRVQ